MPGQVLVAERMGNASGAGGRHEDEGMMEARFCGFDLDGVSPIPRKRFLGSTENDEDDGQEALDESAALETPANSQDDDVPREQYSKDAMMMTGLSTSALIVGLWEVADQERLAGGESLAGGKGEASAVASLLRHVQGGMTTVDCADHYGSSEKLVQAYFKLPEASDTPIEICTKWCPKPGPMTFEIVEEAIEERMKRLFPDDVAEEDRSIDVLHFHWWDFTDTRYVDALAHLAELQSRGKIANIALTNFDAAHMRIVVTSGLQVIWNQVHCSLLDISRPGGQMFKTCEDLGLLQPFGEPVGLIVYGTLAGGFLTDAWLGEPEPDLEKDGLTWMQSKYKRFIDVWGGWKLFQELLTTLREVADSIGQRDGKSITIANIALRYVLEQKFVAGAIVGARLGENEHIEDNQRVFTFVLGEEHKDEIDSVLSRGSAIPGGCGDEYRRPPFLTASGDLSHHLASSQVNTQFHVLPAPNGRPNQWICTSGTIWEKKAGYCRARRVGGTIFVSGTTATHGSIPIGCGPKTADEGPDNKEASPDDIANVEESDEENENVLEHEDDSFADHPWLLELRAEAQMDFIVDKISGALRSLGGSLEDVVRTRVFVQNESLVPVVAQAHGRAFGHIMPANTLIVAGIVGDDLLVEMDVEARLDKLSADKPPPGL